MTKQLGPTFGDEVILAGLGGLPFTWGDTDDSLHGRENLTSAQNTTLDDVIDKHDPAKSRGNIIRTADFIARWTNAEYLKLEPEARIRHRRWQDRQCQELGRSRGRGSHRHE